MSLRGEHVELEDLSLEHLDDLVAASEEDPSLYRWNSTPLGRDAMREYVEKAVRLRAEGSVEAFAIRWQGRVVGSTRFWGIERWYADDGDDSPSVCEIGYTWLAASALRTPVNTDAKRTMLTHAFDEWRVHRVSIVTDVRNERSRAAIERIGFRYEGVLRAERLARDGSVRDTVRFSIVESEWPAVKEHLAGLAARQRV